MTQQEHHTSTAAFAGVTFLVVLTWYAMPDLIRSRMARIAVKKGLLGITALGVRTAVKESPELGELAVPARISTPATAAVVAGAATSSLAATVWFEKAVFGRGERRRARGIRCAHTPAAVGIALLSAALTLPDWGKMFAEKFGSR